jgi:Etoposide-induced protein 2.4 (EI24)
LSKGIYYFLTHRFLWPLMKARLLTATILSLFVIAFLFAFAYLPQVAFLALFHPKGGAWFNGTILVLEEGAIITALLFEAFFVDETQVDIFDAVLVNEGCENLVQEGRPVKPGSATLQDGEEMHFDAVRRLGKPSKPANFYPFSCRQITELIILLPVNFIPIVGIPIFLILTGYRAGPLMGWRYFQLRGFSRKERNKWIKERRWIYAW